MRLLITRGDAHVPLDLAVHHQEGIGLFIDPRTKQVLHVVDVARC